MKRVTLRAFVISSMDINRDPRDFLRDLSKILEETENSEVRMMPITSSNTDNEYDLCCTFENNTIDNEQNLFGTMLRIKDAGEVGDISKKLLSKKKFGVYDIVSSKNTEASYADMNRFYFLIRGKYLVCNLKGHRGIKGYYEAYINWLLKTQVYKFDPKISVPKDINFGYQKHDIRLSPQDRCF